MNTALQVNEDVSTDSELFQLQLEVARRADELAWSLCEMGDKRPDRSYWLEAEDEVLGRIFEPASA